MTGDAILVKEVSEEEIKTNDIISFLQGETIITHRVIGIIEENGIKRYKTKGDNNNTEDKDKITYKQIEGKYQFKISKFRIITDILKSKITLMILIAMMVIIYFYRGELDKRKKERKDKRRKYEERKEKSQG